MLDGVTVNQTHEQNAAIQNESLYSSPEEYQDEDSLMANLNESEERITSYSNEGDSDLSLIPS